MSDYNDQQGQGQRPPKVFGPLDDLKLRLTAAPLNGGRKRPALSVKLYQNNPRLEVRTNVDNDKDYGRITAAMDMPVFFSLLEQVKAAVEAPAGVKYQVKLENKQYKFIRGQRSETPLLDSTVVIGKSEDGVVWISVLAFDKERPRIKFEFLPGDFHAWSNSDGEPYDKGLATQFHARGWVKQMQQLVPQVMVNTYVHVDFGAKRAAAGGGGGQQQGNNNYQQNRGGAGGGGGGGSSYNGGGGNRGSYQQNSNNNNAQQQQHSSAPATTGGSGARVESGWGDDDDLPA